MTHPRLPYTVAALFLALSILACAPLGSVPIATPTPTQALPTVVVATSTAPPATLPPTSALPTATLPPTPTQFVPPTLTPVAATPLPPTPTQPAPASISGWLWHDLCAAGSPGLPPGCVAAAGGGQRANGLFEAGEPAIAGVRVTLGAGVCPSAGLAETTTGAGAASYSFTGLAAGTYCVMIDPGQAPNISALIPGGWTSPAVVDGAIATTVSVGPGESKADVSFGWDFQFLPAPQGGTSACTYAASYVADVTVPDDSVILAGTTFQKVWRVRNDGNCAWGPGQAVSALAYSGGVPLGAVDRVALPAAVAPGGTVDLAVNMAAPSDPGIYTTEWKLVRETAPGSTAFLGFGPSGAAALYARIVVAASPTRLSFAPGHTRLSVDDQIGAGQVKDYVLRLLKDQTLILALSGSGSPRVVVYRATENTPLAGNAGAGGANWNGRLPADGDYVVRVLGGSLATRFNLSVDVPRRIVFEPGGVSATVTGTITGRGSVSYLLRALAGQTMTATVASANNVVGLTIWGFSDGTPLHRAESGVPTFTGRLPANQDYMLVAVPSVDTAVYTLTVTVR
jgi:hypothetical protein